MRSITWRRAMTDIRRQMRTPTQRRTRHKGVVVTTSPLTIYVDGNTSIAVAAHLLGGYTPAISDVVFVDNVDGDLVVVNKYIS
jgi:hypothetical protein